MQFSNKIEQSWSPSLPNVSHSVIDCASMTSIKSWFRTDQNKISIALSSGQLLNPKLDNVKPSKFRHHHVIMCKLKVQDSNDFCHQIVKWYSKVSCMWFVTRHFILNPTEWQTAIKTIFWLSLTLGNQRKRNSKIIHKWM